MGGLINETAEEETAYGGGEAPSRRVQSKTSTVLRAAGWLGLRDAAPARSRARTPSLRPPPSLRPCTHIPPPAKQRHVRFLLASPCRPGLAPMTRRVGLTDPGPSPSPDPGPSPRLNPWRETLWVTHTGGRDPRPVRRVERPAKAAEGTGFPHP
jgi:hypothetical protein